MAQYIIALDQGTTSTRAMAFDLNGAVLARSQVELRQYFPKPGWVEHDGVEILEAAIDSIKSVIGACDNAGHSPAAMGITNQRETTLLWDRKTGRPVHRAIVWQDRRTADFCRHMQQAGHGDDVSRKTGLTIDPYFSATKIRWILDSDAEIRARAEKGELAFGTIECFLLWHLTGGRHISDASNASRTLLFNIKKGTWDVELCALFDVPVELLPEIVDCAGDYGKTDAGIFGHAIPVTGAIGDQQAAAVGQGCHFTGSIKSTYGTGCFVLQNTGADIVKSKNQLISTVAFRLDGELSYALEGSIFTAGAALQWLRDGLGIIESSDESEARAAKLDDNAEIYMVPAFTGLGAPHWDPEARAMISGMTRDTTADHFIRAALESVVYQTNDLLIAFKKDGVCSPQALRIDGGMVANSWFVQFLSDVLDLPVDRPVIAETTALGAAIMAGIGSGLFGNMEEGSQLWSLDKRFEPDMIAGDRSKLIRGWNKALSRCKL
jgi:glycerol kinase